MFVLAHSAVQAHRAFAAPTHEVLASFVLAAGDGGSDKTVLVAIIGAVGLVVATAITALGAAWKRSPTVSQNDLFTKQYIAGLERDRKTLATLREKYSHLREACFERQLDPDQLIREQETS